MERRKPPFPSIRPSLSLFAAVVLVFGQALLAGVPALAHSMTRPVDPSIAICSICEKLCLRFCLMVAAAARGHRQMEKGLQHLPSWAAQGRGMEALCLPARLQVVKLHRYYHTQPVLEPRQVELQLQLHRRFRCQHLLFVLE